MKRLFSTLMVAFTCIALFAPLAAEAGKRFGGGSSFGKQRTVQQAPQKSPDQTTTQQKQAQQQPTQQPQQPSGASKWLGPLAGLAIGAGLGALLANMGLGGAMGGILLALLAGGLVLFLISRFAKARSPAMQFAGQGAPYHEPAPVREPLIGGGAAPAMAPIASAMIPADFPVEEFLRNGKRSFIRLQAANDRKDLNDIREYTTPEMFAEISMQLHERGDAAQRTDVDFIDAELLEVADEGDYSIASVRFTGQIRENDGQAERFDEIWHVQKDLRDAKSSWLLAGIQQVA
ncbi:MAG: Tim44 domain-containing protein [Methylophilaceae bacterium]|nr:Tim44-like domain-containing protein [Methylophilaceae bacterium]